MAIDRETVGKVAAELDKRVEDQMRMVIEEEVKMKAKHKMKIKENCGSNHSAVDYVNKIKVFFVCSPFYPNQCGTLNTKSILILKIRFADRPVVYKEFLKVLTVYQKRHSYAVSCFIYHNLKLNLLATEN